MLKLYPRPDRMSIEDLIRESNGIEGEFRDVRPEEMEYFLTILNAPAVTVHMLQQYALASAGLHAKLRDKLGMDVRVGSYIAPPGGSTIVTALNDLLDEAHKLTPYQLYCRYEALHPFCDGNGRTGRALFHWRSGPRSYAIAHGFLRAFHYATLQAFEGVS